MFGNVSFKHKKTVDDIHATTVVSIKFVGDFRDEVSVISSDLRGVVYLSTFATGVLFCSVNKKCLWTKRLGAAYSLAPLISIGSNANQAYLEVMQRLDKTMYKSEKEQKAVVERLRDVGPSIVGFGSLEEIYVAQVSPKALPLISIRRPPYISPGTVPYLDWGHALTPTFRDQSYPVLAIAWGRTIQLAVYCNQKQVINGLEEPQVELDGFYICDGFTIDACFFLSESLIFIVVNKKEVRILYTQNFTPGLFDADYPS